MNIKTVILLFTVMVLLLSSGCNLGDDCFCTEIFMTQTVRVTDQAGLPLDGVAVTVTFADSGIPIDCSPYHDTDNGQYCILNDNYVGQLTEEGIPITVTFQKPGFVTQIVLYYFNTDSCQCHINLLSGATEIIMLEGCSGDAPL